MLIGETLADAASDGGRWGLASFSQSSDLLMSSRTSAVGTEPGFSRLTPSPGLFSLLPESMIQTGFCQSLEGEKKNQSL